MPLSDRLSVRARPVDAVAAALAAACAAVAALGTLGADLAWAVALGRAIVADGGVPDGVPFAAAPSDGWPNVPVGAEVLLYAVWAAAGEHGLLLLQVGAVGAGFALLAADARRGGAPSAGIATALALTVAAALPHLSIVRLQVFSLALFPLLLLLLRAEARSPSRRVWLLVPLVALWSNLHGAVLVGLAVAGAYLLLERARREPLSALGVLAASLAAACATAAGPRTPAYYLGVLESEAAQRNAGLWAPLSPGSAWDVALVAGILVLGALALRARPRAWELAALGGLALGTVATARTGIWLLLLAAAPAARSLAFRPHSRPRLAFALTAAFAAAAVAAVVRGPSEIGAGDALLRTAVAEARDTPVLAEARLAEQVALAGGTVWASNPLDAFRRADQRLYLDWLEGEAGGAAALARAPRVVLVASSSPAQRTVARDPRFRELARDARAIVYVRR